MKGALPQLVVGTLDINVGPRISSEELAGELPARGARMGRAYLTNVCVALGARRRVRGELCALRQVDVHCVSPA